MNARCLLVVLAATAACSASSVPPIVHAPAAESPVPAGPQHGVTTAAPPAAPPRTCEPYTLPADFSPHGVVSMPREVWQRALDPVVAVLCQCVTKRTRVVMAIQPNLGEIRAETPDEPIATACLEKRLAPGRFEPFEAPASDCIDCGPRHLPKPTGAPPPPAAVLAPTPAPRPTGPTFTYVIIYDP
jgi:hypothetical protein